MINDPKTPHLNAHSSSESAINDQIGGTHYNSLKIQPIEYCMVNKLNACQTKAIKYTTRCLIKHKDKELQKQDIDKAIHSLKMLKEFIDKNVV